MPTLLKIVDLRPTRVIDPRMAAMIEDMANLVGIEGPAERLANLLTQGGSMRKQKLMVASVVGVGGLGKTTLAERVYQNLGDQFQCRAFVYTPDMTNILISMLKQVSKDDPIKTKGKKDDELMRDIQQFLSDKRYLIVIDDVWDESTWKTIKCALVDNNYGSRVIVTTRNLHVARIAATPIGAVYELEPLSDAHSRSLFYKRIFGKEDGIHTELDEVAGRFLKKCGGIPLAIISIASLLASKPTTSWYDVYRRLSGPGLDKDKSMENMRAILSLSFSELPSHLKPCLLYLSFFPEDCKIDKDSLVSRWVAEGLIDEQCGDNLYELYDLGESYFVDLVNRGFIQPLDIDLDGIARVCRVHDFILELLISMSTDDNFVLRSDRQKSIPQQCKIRRLSLQDGETNIVKETEDLSHVRSIIAFGDAYKRMPPLSKFPLLRVLDLEGFPGYNNHPRDLRRLRHLRYLQLRGYLETEVLEEIGNLQYLKTLDLSNANLQDHELPASIAQLKNLQILLVGLNVRMPDGIGNLIQLQVVSWIKAAPNTVDELAKLTELKVLCIYGLGNDESIDKAFLQSLSKLTNLLGIFIDQSGLCSLYGMPDLGRVLKGLQFFRGTSTRFHQLPRWFSSLSQLSGLTITVKGLTQDDIDMLGALSLLRSLQLDVASDGTITTERLLIGSDKPFCYLEELKFNHFARCWLVFGQGEMPRLQRLELSIDVRKRVGGGLDTGLENLTSLKHAVVIVSCYQATMSEVEDAETKIRDAFDNHPNHPDLKLSRAGGWRMVQRQERQR